jgi:hypothetical protein
VSWLIAQFYSAIYTGGLINEVTTFAAFTALIVFLPGIMGVALGRWRVDHNAPPITERSGAGQERGADTDVFSAVRADESPTGELPLEKGAQAQAEQRTAVATAEREGRTETIATNASEAPTESFKLSGSEDKTEVIRTRDAGQTKPDTPKGD